MLLDWDMSGVKVRMGQRTGTISLLICNTRNEVKAGVLGTGSSTDIAIDNCRLLKISGVSS